MNKFKPNNAQKGKKSSTKSAGRDRSYPAVRGAGAMIMAPAAMTRPVQSQKTLQNRRVINFKEYVQDIAGSVAFSATGFPVQPGMSTLFAWLSAQATNYQEYRFRKLRFIYETEKSSSTSGKVMLAFQPDAGDSNPASKQEMLENQFKAANAVWAPCTLNVPPGEALGARRYIRSGSLASNLDIKTYDIGRLVVAAQGCADTTAIGELYVEYEIELFTPVVSAAAQALATSIVITGGGTVSDTALFGTAATYGSGGLGVTASGDVLTFNRVGRYQVVIYATGVGLFTAFTPVITSPSGGSSGVLIVGLSNAAANAGTFAQASFYVYVVSRGTTFTIDCSTQATSIATSGAFITPLSLD
jgi:hypothetical protein